ncbi:MAG: dolichyl-phosphate beta-glucosyltransferase [Cellvibrionaceae bacterium]|jgi:dolichyl-phosphate beta-glucosyltransferase
MTYTNYEQWKHTPLETTPLLSIIIPTYNEQERIIPTIGAICSHLSNLGTPFELIIADDGSKDMTVGLVEALGFVNLHLLKAKTNGGKGSAVRRGMLAAKGDYLLFSDADNSTPIEEVSKLLKKLQDDHYDVVIGSRAAAGAEETEKSLKRRILSNGLRWVVNTILHIGVRDTQCGFKMYTREAARRLHSSQTLMGFSFDLEILYLASKFNYQIAEVPITWIDAPCSKVDAVKEARRFIRDLMKIKINDLRGRYA